MIELDKVKHKSFGPLFAEVLSTDEKWIKYDWESVGYSSSTSAFFSVKDAIRCHGLWGKIMVHKVGDGIFLSKISDVHY